MGLDATWSSIAWDSPWLVSKNENLKTRLHLDDWDPLRTGRWYNIVLSSVTYCKSVKLTFVMTFDASNMILKFLYNQTPAAHIIGTLETRSGSAEQHAFLGLVSDSDQILRYR